MCECKTNWNTSFDKIFKKGAKSKRWGISHMESPDREMKLKMVAETTGAAQEHSQVRVFWMFLTLGKNINIT